MIQAIYYQYRWYTPKHTTQFRPRFTTFFSTNSYRSNYSGQTPANFCPKYYVLPFSALYVYTTTYGLPINLTDWNPFSYFPFFCILPVVAFYELYVLKPSLIPFYQIKMQYHVRITGDCVLQVRNVYIVSLLSPFWVLHFYGYFQWFSLS